METQRDTQTSHSPSLYHYQFVYFLATLHHKASKGTKKAELSGTYHLDTRRFTWPSAYFTFQNGKVSCQCRSVHIISKIVPNTLTSTQIHRVSASSVWFVYFDLSLLHHLPRFHAKILFARIY